MAVEILISVRPAETRVAYVKNGELVDLKIERHRARTLVGSVYLGKVLRVLPGMQAAFVDIGLSHAGFLYVGDVRSDIATDAQLFVEDSDVEDETEESLLVEEAVAAQEQERPKLAIQDLLSAGSPLLVQVAKDPIGTKGARITTHISLPGRNVVYLPTVKHFGVSRRIEGEEERERLRLLVEQLKPKGGVIVRTAGEGATEENLRADLEYLEKLYTEIRKAYKKRKNPGLLHVEMDVELRALRDLLNEEVDSVVVDDREVFKKVVRFLGQYLPRYKNKVMFYEGHSPLLDRYDIDLEISRSLGRKIWLKSGGYIVIDEAEALVVIDVNTGRYVGKKDFEDTILKTNLEAVREIAYQLRIRNCGGIIIVDFIDMEKPAHREKVLHQMIEELKSDNAKTQVISMSELGLVEMTRKRTRPSLVRTLCEPCGYCDGKGYIKQRATVAAEIFRDLEREGRPRVKGEGSPANVVVQCHAEVADWIYEVEREALEYTESKIGTPIIFKVEPQFHIEQYEILRG